MELAQPLIIMQRKEVKTMKIATSLLAALLFTGTLGALNNAMAEDGILEKDQFAVGSYCHEKFPAMTDESLATNNPVLNSSGDIIDFYGPCNENPVGKDQVAAQKLEAQHRWESDYAD
jgi:hypothetical protein